MPQRAIDPHVNPSDETIGTKGLAVHFLLTGDSSNDSIAAFELLVAASQRLPAPAHSHDHYEETIYGIDGVLTWTVDGKQIDVGPGQVLCIPRGAVHRFDNNGSQEAKALCVVTPAAIGPAVFPRGFRGGQCRGGRTTGSGQDGRNHAPSRSHAGAAPGMRPVGGASYRSIRVDRMIDDAVRSTPSSAPMRSIRRSSSPIDAASTMAIRSKLPLTECSVRTSAIARSSASMRGAVLGRMVISTCARISPRSASSESLTP